MYIVQYTFSPKDSVSDLDDFRLFPLDTFLGELYQHGQIGSHEWKIYAFQGDIQCFCGIPHPDSLSAKYYNEACHNAFSHLQALLCHPPELTILGEELGTLRWCTCQHAIPFYIMKGCCDAPIHCGLCDAPVALYTIPVGGTKHSYHSLLQWNTAHDMFFDLWLDSGVGERIGHEQISDPNSELSQDGRALCQNLSQLCHTPFYYYLDKFDVPHHDVCPCCHKPWKLNTKILDGYSHKCDTCFLISKNPVS